MGRATSSMLLIIVYSYLYAAGTVRAAARLYRYSNRARRSASASETTVASRHRSQELPVSHT